MLSVDFKFAKRQLKRADPQHFKDSKPALKKTVGPDLGGERSKHLLLFPTASSSPCSLRSVALRSFSRMDGFDRLPDSLILLIFNSVSDIKTLIRCRAVSKRFNSLVPQTESLSLKVDCVISSESGDDDSFLVTVFKSIIKSFHDLVSPNRLLSTRTRSQNSPAEILRGFERVRDLEIELPSGDLTLEKGAVLKWRAEFGSTLRSCVILGFRAIRGSSTSLPEVPGDEGETDLARGLKLRVVWTISALIAASARHYLLKEVVQEQRELEKLVLRDRDGEGTLVMDKAGLAQLRESAVNGSEIQENEEDEGWERNRTRVPSVKMRMRHESRLKLDGGVWAEGATLVVARPSLSGTRLGGSADLAEELREEAEMATGAFGEGLYGEAVRALLKSRSYLLEMNSF